MRRFTVAPLVFSFALACGSFRSSDEVPLADDGGTPPDAAAAVDAPSEADASADVASDADDGGEPACGFVEFTDAFDRADVQGTWLSGPNNGDGVTVSSGIAPTPKGNSWQIDVVEVATGGRYRNYRHVPAKKSGATPTCIELSFSIFPGNVAGTGMAVGSLELDSITSLSLWIRAESTIELVEQTTNGDTFTVIGVAPLALAQWHTVRLRHAYGAAAGAPSFVVDGTTIAVKPLQLLHGAPLSIYFGAGFAPQDTQAKYWLDELRIR